MLNLILNYTKIKYNKMNNIKSIKGLRLLTKKKQATIFGGWNCQPQNDSYCDTTCIDGGFFSIKYCTCICGSLQP